MSVYCVTGKLGNGKTLVCVGRIRDALRQGLRVATNLDIDLKAMFGKDAKNIDFIRIPDKPTLEDFEAIGKGYTGDYDEKKFGVLILDECGTWFNSRNWQDKTRKAVNDWMLHARKLRWHLYIIIQDISILDSQARDAICELLVTCKRLDNVRVPFIAPLFKMITGINLTLPRIHRAKVVYGDGDGLLCDVWTYRGNDLFECYETDQMFLADYPHGTHSVLTPWHLYGRHKKPLTPERLMRITKVYWKRFKSPLALATGLLMGATAMMVSNVNAIQHELVKTEFLSEQRQYMKTELQAHDVKKSSSSSSSSSGAQSLPLPELLTPEQKSQTLLSSMRITGVIKASNVFNYLFAAGDRSLSSRDLIGMGFSVIPYDDCSVSVSQGDLTQIIRCI